MSSNCARCVAEKGLPGFAAVGFCPACGRRRISPARRVARVVLIGACGVMIIAPMARLLHDRPPAGNGIASAARQIVNEPGRMFVPTADVAPAPAALPPPSRLFNIASPPQQSVPPAEFRADGAPAQPPIAPGVRLRDPWQNVSQLRASTDQYSTRRPLTIFEPEMNQPTVGSECRGAFLLKNTGRVPIDLSSGPGARYEVSILQNDRELCRCGGSWGPILGPGQEIRTSWSTHYDSLSVHPTGPFKPFILPAPGEYRCRITLRLGGIYIASAEAWETRFTVDR